MHNPTAAPCPICGPVCNCENNDAALTQNPLAVYQSLTAEREERIRQLEATIADRDQLITHLRLRYDWLRGKCENAIHEYLINADEAPDLIDNIAAACFADRVEAIRIDNIAAACEEPVDFVGLMQRVGEQKRSPRELLRMPKEKRSRILRTAAAKAESDYRRNRDLTDYEANGEEDFHES